MTMPAVARSTVVVAPLSDDHFEQCLAIWVHWMQQDRLVHGFPGQAWIAGRSRGGTSDDDTEIAYRAADIKLAEAVNACVESLMPSHRHAVYIARGLARAWLFKDLAYELELANGVACLRRLIARRC